MSKFKDLKVAFDNVQETHLAADETEAHFRYWLLRLLFEINSNLDSLSASYREMAALAKKKAGPR